MSSAITYLSRYPDVYAYPGPLGTFGIPASTYLNVYSNVSLGGYLRGGNIIVSGGTAVLLTTTQLQTFGSAIRQHLATGSTNVTVNGVVIQTSGANVNITAGKRFPWATPTRQISRLTYYGTRSLAGHRSKQAAALLIISTCSHK